MTMPRRAFLTGASLTVLAAAIPRPGWARGRILADPSISPPEELMPPGTATKSSPELQRTARALRIGAVSRHGALAVLWLHGLESPAAAAIATLDEARASGALVLTERETPTVPHVTVENRGKSPVLLLAGEILVGGKQNRVLREDLLLPPRSGPLAIGVYCVEQGRWNEGRRDFDSKSSFAQPGLRRELQSRADQGRIWQEVARATQAAAAPSPTSSYQQVYEQPAMRDHLADAERVLDARAAAGVVGAAVFVGSSLSGIDVFGDAGLFAREWRKLLRAHAVDAYSRPGAPAPDADLRSEVTAIVRSAADAHGTVRTNAGVGYLFEFRAGRYRGAALAYESAVVHAVLL